MFSSFLSAVIKGTAQLLKSWTRARHHCLRVLFHPEFYAVLDFYHKRHVAKT